MYACSYNLLRLDFSMRGRPQTACVFNINRRLAKDGRKKRLFLKLFRTTEQTISHFSTV